MREQAEPPSTKPTPTAELFLVGRNSRGNWVVRDKSGLRGGLFIDCAEALRFDLFENGRRPQGAIMIPGVPELDLTKAVSQPSTDPEVGLERKAA